MTDLVFIFTRYYAVVVGKPLASSFLISFHIAQEGLYILPIDLCILNFVFECFQALFELFATIESVIGRELKIGRFLEDNIRQRVFKADRTGGPAGGEKTGHDSAVCKM